MNLPTSYEEYREMQDEMFNDSCGGNEFQNAFALSRMEAPAGEEKEAKALAAAGKFVVCYAGEYFCPMTDAFIKTLVSIVSVHDTREAAEAECVDGECFIMPKVQPVAAPTYDRTNYDDIPF